jgi:hypothetical protein
MNRSTFVKKLNLITLLCISRAALAVDNPHFWRATNFLPEFYEPRLAKPWLSSFDVALGYGSTTTARNSRGNKVPLGDIYGLYNMLNLGINVPGKNLTTPQDIVLTQLELLAPNDGFGMLSFQGKFKLIEANLSVSQNLSCGFFVQAHLPVRHIEVSDIQAIDLSPTDCNSGPNKETPVWQHFLALFPSILERYGLSINPISYNGVGDLTILGGWTNNFEETQEIDYFDTTFRIGVLFPTGHANNESEVFDIANGYDGFYAVPISFAAAVGWYDWFTVGAFIGGMPFMRKNKFLHLKTDCAQSGLIKLAQGECRVDPGTIWESNFYIKGDHVLCGLSFLVGYSFANKNRDVIIPLNTIIFDPMLVNTDPEFWGWKMHTVNLLLEYDFATYCKPWLPHVGAFFNVIVGGKRIFNTNMVGIEAGFSFALCF